VEDYGRFDFKNLVCYTLRQMNTLAQLFAQLVGFVLVIMIMSYGLGYIIGGPNKANMVITWELKKLAKFGRWVGHHLFHIIGDICHYIAKKIK
jgi:hypothetical protein